MTTKAKAILEPIARYHDFDDDVKEESVVQLE